MRLLRLTLGLLLIVPVITTAQTPPPAAESTTTPAALPVRRVVLYKTGVGYFEHLGKVRNRQDVTIRFTSAQLDDVLKSLTTMDLGKGQITGISYNSVAPLSQRLGALRIPLDAQATGFQLLGALRGARVEVGSGAGAISGRVLSVEQRQQQGRGGESRLVDLLSIVTDAGDLRTFEMTPAVHVRIADRELRQEVGRYLDLVGSTRDQDARSMVISTNGTGERPLFVSYISEVPIWKTTYRLVLPSKNKPLLQGWAIVDNTIGEDWQNVELSLVAGAPQSFIQQISQPYYGRRPVVPMPPNVLLSPQTHQATLTGGPPVESLTEAVTVLPAAPMRSRSGFAGGAPGGVVGGVVGGLPAAPPPPPTAAEVYDRISQVQAAASGNELGDLFEYRLKEPVTLRKNESALVPIVNAEIDVEKVSLWNRNNGSGRPLRALWLKNSTGLTLDGGTMTIIDGDAFAGEGLIDPLKPGERRLVSYAADLGTLVDARVTSTPERIFRVRARDGVLTQESEERASWTYRVRNENTTPTTLVIEHQLRPGWKLQPGQSPVETTLNAERFRVVLEPKAESTLVVQEIRPGHAQIMVGDIDETLMARIAQSGVSATALEAALKPVIDKKTELASIERRLQGLQQQREAIVRDQERLRENMKALRGSAEEKQLLQRYTRQLDEQETRLETLQQEIAAATAARDKAREELSRIIGSVSFEVGG